MDLTTEGIDLSEPFASEKAIPHGFSASVSMGRMSGSSDVTPKSQVLGAIRGSMERSAGSGLSPQSSVSRSPLGASPPNSSVHMRTSMAACNSPSFRQNRNTFFIGVAGGTASGKTTVCDMILSRLHDQSVVLLTQDAFYKSLTEEQLADVANVNFDHPDALDTKDILRCVMALSQGQAVDVPVYDFATHKRSDETRRVEPADVIILEGILVLHMQEIRPHLNMKVYVDTDDDVRLARRIQRDVSERGRDVGGVIQQYTRFVKPAFDTFIAPSRRHADLIVPWHGSSENRVAVDLITQHIRSKLKQHSLLRIYPNLEVIPSTYQIRGLHTIMRDRTTNKNDFIFYANRLNRIVVEAALGHLPFKEKTVVTPTGHQYVGVEFARGICGVSVIRSGEAMEAALRECCQGIKIGKILIHRGDDESAEDNLVYEKLPSDIASRFVMLMDPVVGTGKTMGKAVKVLLEKGVKEEKIVILTLLAAPEGIHHVCRMYPKLKLLTSEIDAHVDGRFRVVPGVGNFADRYFTD